MSPFLSGTDDFMLELELGDHQLLGLDPVADPLYLLGAFLLLIVVIYKCKHASTVSTRSLVLRSAQNGESMQATP